MASTTTTTPSPFAAKQLGELLQQQQEPFTLEVYLLERAFLRRSVSCAINKRRKVIPNCSKIARAVFNKFVSINHTKKNPKSRDLKISVTKLRKSSQEIVEDDRFSSASSTSVFNSCSESDKEKTYEGHASRHRNLYTEGEVAMDRNFQRMRCVDDSKQLSPVSVLEETLYDETSPVHNIQHNVKTRQEEASTTSNSILSVSLCKFPDQSLMEKPELQELVGFDLSSHYMKIKMALQQTKQLLFDSVREAIETRRCKDTRRKQFPQLLGPEELGKLLFENICTWSRQCIDGTIDKTQLLNSDLLASAEDWRDLEQQRKEIAMEIGDVILDDIRNEFVTEIMSNTRSPGKRLSNSRGETRERKA